MFLLLKDTFLSKHLVKSKPPRNILSCFAIINVTAGIEWFSAFQRWKNSVSQIYGHYKILRFIKKTLGRFLSLSFIFYLLFVLWCKIYKHLHKTLLLKRVCKIFRILLQHLFEPPEQETFGIINCAFQYIWQLYFVTCLCITFPLEAYHIATFCFSSYPLYPFSTVL